MRVVLASLLGALAGFAASAETTPGAVPAIADDAEASRCVCDKVACTTTDGMRNQSAACSVRCTEGRVATCNCGKCNDDGHVQPQNTCRCKSPE